MSDLTSGTPRTTSAGRTWYDILNPNAPGTQAITVHGGPGTPHDYLRPLADALPGHPVVVYDQSVCGRSAQRHVDGPPWRLEYFVDELEALVGTLGFERFHLLGDPRSAR